MNIQRVDIPDDNYGGVNHGRLFIIVHANGATDESTMHWLKNSDSDVSYHYLINLEGGVMQFVDEGKRAWHAGRSTWDGHHDLNDVSVGVAIESEEGTHSQVTETQYETLLELIRDIQERHSIRTDYVRGHKEVSPNRKTDPIHIDMDKLRRDLDNQDDTDEIHTLVLHGFDNLTTRAEVVVRGKMQLRTRGDKVDIRLEQVS
jgi:N-acetyl-anhydromuramyl-L-alanine amidase AmpD